MKNARRFVGFSLPLLGLVALAHAEPAWTGRVVDIRTGRPIQGAEVCGGVRGRVDIVVTTSKADGSFVARYPEGFKADWYYLWVFPPKGAPYLHYVERRKRSEAVEVRLVPSLVHFRGRVVDAETGRPLRGVRVSLGTVGAIWRSVRTDERGEFQFQYDAYPPGSMGLEAVPDEHLPPDARREQYRKFVFRVDPGWRSGYKRLATIRRRDGKEEAIPLPLCSSATPEIHTWLEFRLPKGEGEVSEPSRWMEAKLVGLRKEGVTAPGERERVFRSMSVEDIERCLRRAGVHFEARRDKLGEPLFVLEMEGYKVFLLTYGWSGERCKSLQLAAFFETRRPVSLEVLNEWNRTKRFSSAYRDGEGRAVLQSDLDLEGGVTEGAVLEFIRTFRISLRAFVKHLGL